MQTDQNELHAQLNAEPNIGSPGHKEKEMKQALADDEKQQKGNIINNIALQAIIRIRSKLNGKDFNDKESLNYRDQVEKLIIQATSHENICQAYVGWGPFL